MKTYNIRFLKAGLSSFKVPDGTSPEDTLKLAEEHLHTLSDQDLYLAMSDCVPSVHSPSKFDTDSFQVEALEDPESNYKYIYRTNLWKEYIGEQNGIFL